MEVKAIEYCNDKKGRSIRIRIETYTEVIAKLNELDIKKEDPLE